jgi:hypothetical protein
MARNVLALLFFASCRLSSSRHNTRAFPRRPQSLFLLAAAKSLHRFSASDFQRFSVSKVSQATDPSRSWHFHNGTHLPKIQPENKTQASGTCCSCDIDHLVVVVVASPMVLCVPVKC